MSLYLGNTKIKQINVVFNDGVDTDVTTGNIKTGIRILGVDGSYTANGTQSTGYELATSEDIVDGKCAWADGSEVIGGLVVNTYYTGTTEPDNSIGINGDIYLQY